MMREEAARRMLFDLDYTIQRLTMTLGVDNAKVVRLGGIYHNPVRYRAET